MKPTHFRQINLLGSKGYASIVKNEIKAFFAYKGAVFQHLLTPILYFLFIVLGVSSMQSVVPYKGLTLPYSQYALTGILAMMMLTDMSHAIYRVTIDKQYGLLGMKLLSGIRPVYYVIGMSTYSLLSTSLKSAVLLVLAALLGHGFTLMQSLGVYALVILMSLFWTSIGVMITVKIKDYKTRDNFVSFVVIPVSFAAPTFFAVELAPRMLQLAVQFNPLTHQLQFMRDLLFLEGDFIGILWLILLSAASIAVASYVINRAQLTLAEHG